MDSNMYTQWVQSPVQESAQHEPRADEWPKDRPVGANGGSPTIDMSDFTTLGDIGGSSTSSLLPTSSQSFYSYGQSYFVPAHFPQIAYPTPWPTSLPVSSYSTLNGATTSSSAQNHQQQHSPTQQLGQQQQQQQSQHQQQQQSIQHPSTSQHMIIDPPILTLNGSNSSHLQQSFSHSPPFSPQLTSQQQQQQQQQQQAQRPPQYYAQQQPHLIYPSPYYRHQTPVIPQGTLSPQSLHSPTTNSMMGIPPNSFYASLQGGPLQHEQLQQLSTLSMQTVASPVASTSQAQSPTESTPAPGLTQEQKEERKLRFQNSIRPFLQSAAFTGAGAVNQLTNLIIDYGVTEVDASMRLEILARIRDGAGNHYYRAWCENANAIDITREWIKAAAKGNNAALIETTMPLLHLLDRLPLSIETLTSSKIGKVIKKLAKDEPIAAIKDMASNLENRWRTMVNDAKEKVESKPGEGSDAKTKNLKRKPTEPASSVKVAAPSKKPNLGQTASSASIKPVAVKKEPSLITISKATAGPVKDAKADSSFFSAPKPKAKLPSFKKAPIQVLMKKEEANIAQPSSINPFEEALKSMKTRNSPAVSTPPAISSTSTLESQPGLAKNGKKRKTVSWAPDDQLEQIREIQRAIYDDDPIDGTHVSHSYRDLERGEGQALSKPVFEETIDWAEPLLVEMTPESEGAPGKTPKGGSSEEKLRQEEREQTALGAIFMSLSQIPESPAEPNVILTEEDTDKNVTYMTVGPELDGFFFHNTAAAAAPTASVADLVGQLGNNQMDSSMDTLNLNANGVASNAGPPQDPLAGLSPDQITALLQQFSKSMLPVTGGAFGEISPYGNHGTGDSSWASTPPQYGNSYGSGYIEDSQQSDPSQSRWPSERGAGGRGRGRSRGRGRGEDGYRPYIKRKPCSFFAAGRCKYGDHCDFAHDLSLLEH